MLLIDSKKIVSAQLAHNIGEQKITLDAVGNIADVIKACSTLSVNPHLIDRTELARLLAKCILSTYYVEHFATDSKKDIVIKNVFIDTIKIAIDTITRLFQKGVDVNISGFRFAIYHLTHKMDIVLEFERNLNILIMSL
jgi:hypothetical protein